MKPLSTRGLTVLFVGSGFTAVAYQVLLSRYINLIVGVTAYAISALLVAFMLGISAGSAVGGRLADRVRAPLKLYALAEAGIGIYGLAFPVLFRLVHEFYLRWAPPIDGGDLAVRNALRFVTGVAAFIWPSFLMGITTPAFARALTADRSPEAPSWVVRLYTWNTAGAALGAFLTAYVIGSLLGFGLGILLLAAINLSIAAVAWSAALPVRPVETPEAAAPAASSPSLAAPLAVATVSGFVCFALEVHWTHLLAILLGNSVYAFGLMLGCLLLGLALGASAARRVARDPLAARDWIGASLVAAGLWVLGTRWVWDDMPSLFLALGQSSPGFATMELARLAVALAMLLAPTATLGMAFPLALQLAAGDRTRLGARIGLTYAVNTLGAVAGAMIAPYWLLPWLGSLGALRLLGAVLGLVGLAAIAALARPRWRTLLAVPALVALVLAWAAPVSWDIRALSSASAIYLGRSGTEASLVTFQKEDATGGLTTVIEKDGVSTLLTNGKFQGDDFAEIPIQHRLANIPTLFVPGRERALVIGLGTGVTLASLAAHPFREVVCAEISAPIVEAARTRFAHVNGNVLGRPQVKLLQEDGRSVLQESEARYDVISVEVTTIWFAGMGALYSREFYELAAQRLRQDGALLQWFPMHHMSARNMYVVINTVRSVFPHVSVWAHRHQAFVVASLSPLRVRRDAAREAAARPELAYFMRELDSGSPLELLGDVVITDRDVDPFLDTMAGLLHTHRGLVATDTWPTLEYETPKDILNDVAYDQIRALFERFRSRQPPPFDLPPSPAEALLADTAFLRGWRDPRALAQIPRLAAQKDFSRVAAQWLMQETGGEAAASATLECVPQADAVTFGGSPRLQVEASTGHSLYHTEPAATVDGAVAPSLAGGWTARSPDGYPLRLDLRLDAAQPLEDVVVSGGTSDESPLGLEIYGRRDDGSWRVLAAAEGSSCRARRFRLPDDGDVAALSIMISPRDARTEVTIDEVWVGPRRPHLM